MIERYREESKFIKPSREQKVFDLVAVLFLGSLFVMPQYFGIPLPVFDFTLLRLMIVVITVMILADTKRKDDFIALVKKSQFVIFPKEYFEIGTLTGKHYAVHLCAGEWREKAENSGSLKDKIKLMISKNQTMFNLVQILVRKRRYSRLKKNIPFYEYYLAQKKNKRLPEL